MLESILFERQKIIIELIVELEKKIREMQSEIERLKADNHD